MSGGGSHGGDGAAGEQPKPADGEAIVSFTTTLPEQYQVPDDQLVVPSSLARYGLSEVLNRLLGFERPVPFDFLIDGEFLRTSIAQYLEARKLTAEKSLQLEYVLALSEPDASEVDEVPDWISGIVALGALPAQCFAAVCYDGTVRLYDGARATLTARLSDAALTGVAALPVGGGHGCHLIAAGKDGLARCCAVKLGGDGPAAGPVSTLSVPGRRKAGEAVAINEDGTLLASAGWDQDVLVWNAEQDLFAAPEDVAGGAKRKVADGGEGKSPKFALKGHSQVVSCLQFGTRDRYPFTLLSSSWDCSVRVWDIAAASCVCNWAVARAVTSFSTNPGSPPQLATSHEDGHVSLWDIRAPPHPEVKGAVSLDVTAGLPLASAQAPHRRLAAQVAWCPEDNYRLASVGHDGRLCILDPRSPKMPMQSLRVGKPDPSPTKLLCVAWLSRDELATGGSDGKVVRISLAGSAQKAVEGDDGA